VHHLMASYDRDRRLFYSPYREVAEQVSCHPLRGTCGQLTTLANRTEAPSDASFQAQQLAWHERWCITKTTWIGHFAAASTLIEMLLRHTTRSTQTPV
jgi:hypothetical protein